MTIKVEVEVDDFKSEFEEKKAEESITEKDNMKTEYEPEESITGVDVKKNTAANKGKKSHSCSQCGKVFSLKRKLRKHTKLHAKDRPYVCSHCDKAFLYKSLLIRHTNTHTQKDLTYVHIVGEHFFTSHS